MKERTLETPAYRVEREDECKACGKVRFLIIGPGDVGEGIDFEVDVDAEEHAEALNGAYEKGYAAAIAEVAPRS